MDIVKQLYKGVSGPLGGAFGGLGKPFAEHGAKYGVQSLDYNPTDYFDANKFFNPTDYFDLNKAFDAEKMANDYLSEVIGLV